MNVTRELDTTIMDRAMTDKNPDECQKIQNEELKVSCNDAVIYDRAMTDKNIELCGKIIEE
jgi:capsular polysaccharide biosynthesis protein